MSHKPRGATYRPATLETQTRIEHFQEEHGLTWNAAINMLVLLGLRTIEEDPKALRPSGGGR